MPNAYSHFFTGSYKFRIIRLSGHCVALFVPAISTTTSDIFFIQHAINSESSFSVKIKHTMSESFSWHGSKSQCRSSAFAISQPPKTFRRRLITTVLVRFTTLTCLLLVLTVPCVSAVTTPANMNLSIVLDGKPNYSDIVLAFTSNNLIQELISGGQPLTLLAPSNAAFDALPVEQADAIEKSNTGSYVLRVRHHALTPFLCPYIVFLPFESLCQGWGQGKCTYFMIYADVACIRVTCHASMWRLAIFFSRYSSIPFWFPHCSRTLAENQMMPHKINKIIL